MCASACYLVAGLWFCVRLTVHVFLHRGRPSGGKVRHKRQALQDMARPLKQWLYKHRDNPYPTKTEKILLALGSQMTLVQVSLLSVCFFFFLFWKKLKLKYARKSEVLLNFSV